MREETKLIVLPLVFQYLKITLMRVKVRLLMLVDFALTKKTALMRMKILIVLITLPMMLVTVMTVVLK